MRATTLIRSVPALFLVGCAHTARMAPAQQLPAGQDSAVARLNASPRHGEYVKIDAGGGDSVRAWVSYPERRDKAPVVVVIHEIFGLSDWIRSVADQLAAEGYIAIAPDLLTGHGPNGGGTESVDQQGAVALIRTLMPDQINHRLVASAHYAMGLPAARPIFGTVGFCWGGGQSFTAAYSMEGNHAAVVYYGAPTPDSASLDRIAAPVLGLYGGDDARVDASVPPAQHEMQRVGKPFDAFMFAGAGHGFLRDQAGRDGANLRAAQQAWPRTIAFFRAHLGR